MPERDKNTAAAKIQVIPHRLFCNMMYPKQLVCHRKLQLIIGLTPYVVNNMFLNMLLHNFIVQEDEVLTEVNQRVSSSLKFIAIKVTRITVDAIN